jgi:hypothetical protein
LSGSSSSSTWSGPRSRNSRTSRFCSPPEQAQRGLRADVPDHLDVVAAGVAVLGQGRGVGELRRLVVGVHQHQLAAVHLGRGRAHPGRGDRAQQVGDGRVGDPVQPVPDELAHHPQPAGAGHGAGVREQVAGHDPQQRGLPGAVRADQGDLGAVADPERDVVEQYSPVRQLVAHPGDVHVAHGCGVSRPARDPDSRFRRWALR